MAALDSIPAVVRGLSSRKRSARVAAAVALRQLADSGSIADGSSRQMLDAIAAAGAVPALVQLLQQGAHEGSMLLPAANTLWCLVEDEDEQCCAAVAAAGGIPPLVALMEPGGSGEHTAWALVSLVRRSARRAATVVAAGGVPRLLRVLRDSSAEMARSGAATTLCYLALHGHGRAIEAAGGIPVLVHSMHDSSSEEGEGRQLGASGALLNMLLRRGRLAEAVVAAGAVPHVVRLLQRSTNEIVLSNAAGLVHQFAYDQEQCRELAGAIAPLARLAGSSNARLQAASLAAQAGLATYGDESVWDAMLAAGALRVLMHAAGSGSSSAARGGGGVSPRSEAVRALTGLTSDAGEHSCQRCAAVAAAGAIPLLLQLLATDSGDDIDSVQAYAAITLEQLVHSSGERGAALVAAGGVPRLLSALRGSSLESGLRLARLAAACRALCWLASTCAAHVAAIAEAGSIPLLADALQASLRHAAADEDEEESVARLQLGATGAFCNLLFHNLELAGAVIAAGALPPLVQLFDASTRCTSLANGVDVLAQLARAGHGSAVAACSALPALARLLSRSYCQPCCDVNVHGAASAAVLQLAESPHLCPELEASGCVRALERLLRCSSSSEVRGEAADALRAYGASSTKARLAAGGGTAPPKPPRVCAAPGCTATHGLRLCGGCALVRYCSEACSRAHWREHRADCRRLQAAAIAAGNPA